MFNRLPMARPQHLNLPEDATALGESFFYWTHRPEFGAWLRARREEAGVNLKDAAEALGLSFGKLQMMETGKRTKAPSYELLEKIAQLCGRTTGEVMEQAGVKMVRPSTHFLPDRLDRTFEQLVGYGSLTPGRMTRDARDCYSALQKRQWIEFALKLEAHVRAGGVSLESILVLPEDEEEYERSGKKSAANQALERFLGPRVERSKSEVAAWDVGDLEDGQDDAPVNDDDGMDYDPDCDPDHDPDYDPDHDPDYDPDHDL